MSLHRFSVARYHKMIEARILDEGDTIELLEGYLVEMMPTTPSHDVSIQRINKRVTRLALAGWEVRIQSTITLADSEPEPDVTSARGDDSTLVARHPEPAEIGCLMEVSDSTLDRDRVDKARIYARARIAVYWIVNLVDRQIEVYTQPTGAANLPAYAHRQDYWIGDAVPLILDGQQVALIPVAEIMP
jgi:Uma2 family endonuclease